VRSPFSVTKLAASSGTALGFPVTSPLEVPIAVVVDPHEPELVYVGGSAASGGAVQLLDTAAGGAAPAVIATPGAVQALVVSPDGTRLYAADFGDDSVAVIDLATFTLLTTIPVGPQPGSIAVSPDGATVYTTSSAGGTLSIIDVASEQVVQRGLGFAPRAVAVSPDGAHVYVTDVNHDALAVFGLPAPVSDPPSDDDELAATGAWSAGWVPAAAVGSLLLGALSLAVVTRRRRA
jgi:YVTN family beta-propeller protein